MSQPIAFTCLVALLISLNSETSLAQIGKGSMLKVVSMEQLQLPPLSVGEPRAGRRVKVTPEEFSETEVYHTVYLPESWNPSGQRLPIIFEYTGNFFPNSGSTGEVKDAGLGYGLSAGKYIWVVLPCVGEHLAKNEVTWWGSTSATVQYAKTNVPRIIAKYHASPKAVLLCGFSRGAIGVNHLGLHDEEVARLWTGFVTHDHYDGVKEWPKTKWGSPLDKYRGEAAQRLRRVSGRPYMVIQNGKDDATINFIESVLPSTDNFTFMSIDAAEIFGTFPNEWAKSGHTDRWPLLPSRFRQEAWRWMNKVSTN